MQPIDHAFTERTTFVIAPGGKIAAVFSSADDKIAPSDHATKSLAAEPRSEAQRKARRPQRAREAGGPSVRLRTATAGAAARAPRRAARRRRSRRGSRACRPGGTRARRTASGASSARERGDVARGIEPRRVVLAARGSRACGRAGRAIARVRGGGEQRAALEPRAVGRDPALPERRDAERRAVARRDPVRLAEVAAVRPLVEAVRGHDAAPRAERVAERAALLRRSRRAR